MNIPNLSGFASLSQVTGGILIYDCPNLSSISQLSTVTKINPNLESRFEFGISLYRLPKLTSLNGLENLVSIGNFFYISQNNALSSLEGVPKSVVAVNITIDNNPVLNDISQLSGWINGVKPTSIQISFLKSLPSLNGLQGVSSIGNLIIKTNSALNDVSAIQSASIKGPIVEISDNGKLCQFNGVNSTASAVSGSKVVNACGIGAGSKNDGIKVGLFGFGLALVLGVMMV